MEINDNVKYLVMVSYLMEVSFLIWRDCSEPTAEESIKVIFDTMIATTQSLKFSPKAFQDAIENWARSKPTEEGVEFTKFLSQFVEEE